jgi:TonB family protein
MPHPRKRRTEATNRIDNPLFSGETPLRTVILSCCCPVMPQSPTPQPDPSKPSLSATGVLRAQPDDAHFETDFAQLAARFATQSGGGLSPELSTDLALEIVLNEVVEQACLTTGATGAAIALERDGEMVCRASSGSTAPELGSRLDAASGLSGECIRTRRTQRCDDAWADLRVDFEASQQLGVRSIMVMPLLREGELVGLFELFSSLPEAFRTRDELTLGALAARILDDLKRSAEPLPLPPPPQSLDVPVEELVAVSDTREVIPAMPEEIAQKTTEDSWPRRFDFATWGLRGAVLACAVLLGVLLSLHPGKPRAMARPRPVAPPTAAGNTSATSKPPLPADTSGKQKEDNAAAQSSSASSRSSTPSPPSPSSPSPTSSTSSTSSKGGVKPAPLGSLLVFENGKEIFRMPPARNDTTPQQTASSSIVPESGLQRASSAEPEKLVEFSPAAAEDGLLHRVEPEYPEDALQQKVQGAVVLEVQIGQDGGVEDAHVVSGPPQLAKASTDAVKQWRFQPRLVNGRPEPMQTRVTLNFKLPQ